MRATHPTKCWWYHLGGVSCCDNLKDTPRDTGQQVSDQDHRDVLGEKQDKDASGHGHHSDHVYRPVPVPRLRPSVDEETEDLTARCGVVDARLPIRWDQGLAAFGVVGSKLLEKCALSEEVVDLWDCQSYIVIGRLGKVAEDAESHGRPRHDGHDLPSQYRIPP